MTYDLIILGAGIAGTTAAQEACRRGMSVLLCDPNPVGGLCLHEGCIPAKVCLSAPADLPYIVKRRQYVLDALHAGLSYSLEEAGVVFIPSMGTYLGKKENRFQVRCEDTIYESRYLLSCCGGTTNAPQGALTPEQVFTMDALPKSAVILGAGAAGLETADYLQKMGTDVTILEQNETLLPAAEPELSAALRRSLRKKGIALHLNAGVRSFTQTDVQTAHKTFSADAVIHATGRTARPVPKNVPGLFVAGDQLSHHCTAHAAMGEALCAVRTMCGESDSVDYRLIPNVVFTSPGCGWIGDTEKSAINRGVTPVSATVSLKSCGGSLAAGGDGNGVLKLVADQKGTILGFHLCAESAAELLSAGVVLVSGEISVQALSRMQFPHPTVSESISLAAKQITERLSLL